MNKLTKKQKLFLLIAIIVNMIIPIVLGIRIGQHIWDIKTTEDIILTILGIILGITGYIYSESLIIMISHDFYKENNND